MACVPIRAQKGGKRTNRRLAWGEERPAGLQCDRHCNRLEAVATAVDRAVATKDYFSVYSAHSVG
jgi:hypothetical protein